MPTNKNLTIVLLFLMAVLSTRSSCHKSSAVPPRVDEHPMADFLDTARNLTIFTDYEPFPDVFGYTFVSAKAGVLWAIGCKMVLPNNLTDSFTLSLWDDSTHQLILMKRMRYADSSRFGMLDLTPTRETIPLKANYKYLVAISRVYGFNSIQPCFEMGYDASGPFNILPLTQGHITFLYQRTGNGDASTTPVFPSTLVTAGYVINGFVDIGFYATEN